MKHFIFGYGSLICPQSRSVTAPTLQSIAEPVMIQHIERTWSARVLRGDSLVLGQGREHIQGWTPMGIQKSENARCNGVLIHVDDEELKRFDIREEGYTRHRVDVGHVYRYCDDLTDSVEDSLDGVQCPECRHVFDIANKKRSATDDAKEVDDLDSNIAVWVYIQNEIQNPNPSYPFTQSYLDVIMRGCFSVSKDFARMFLQTTTGWWHDGKSEDNPNKDNDDESKHEATVQQHHTWVDDRHSPMYVRADSDFSLEHASTIDQLIEEHHPHAIKKRVVSM